MYLRRHAQQIQVLIQRQAISRRMSSSTTAAKPSKPIITLSSLRQIHPTTLAPILLDPEQEPKVAVIDVRDSDHIGGNINGSTWIPIHQLDARMPELLRTLKDKEQVVFHCMLSQQRGPKAALMYARAKRSAEDKADAAAAKAAAKQDDVSQAQPDAGTGDDLENQKKGDTYSKPAQEVCVLEGGFGWWQSRYGEDPRLTANYEADIWV